MPSAAKLQALSQQTSAVASEPGGSPCTEPGSGSEARPEEAQLLSLDLPPAFLDAATGQLPRMWRQLSREEPGIFEYFWSARRQPALSQQTAAVASEPSGSPSTEPGRGSEARRGGAQRRAARRLITGKEAGGGPSKAAKRRSRKKQQSAN